MVEQTLREDPAAAYGKMDFATRDRYRHAVEKMARSSRLSEREVARHAIHLAQQGASRSGGDGREAHVGFYLIDKGVPQLERTAEVRLSTSDVASANERPVSVAPLCRHDRLDDGDLHRRLTGTGVCRGRGRLVTRTGRSPVTTLHKSTGGRAGELACDSVGDAACAAANGLLQGYPPESSALVVVPTMLSSVENIEELIEALEVRFLANRDDHLHFGLLTDFRDAHEETLPEDEPLLRLAQKRIEELNGKYREATRDAFFLFHRPRRWNPGERVWMGYERKRGQACGFECVSARRSAE